MNRQKGVSQVLALIIAAAVLMMAALTVIFMTQEGLTGTNEDRNRAQCQSTVETQCSISSDGEISVPSTCKNSQGDPISEYLSSYQVSGNTITCTQS